MTVEAFCMPVNEVGKNAGMLNIFMFLFIQKVISGI